MPSGSVLSGKVRWQQIALFALFALVPAVSLAVLGLSAVASTEGAAQREVAAMVAAAAERTSRTIDRRVHEAEEALGEVQVDETWERAQLEADLASAAPPFADAVGLAADRTWLVPKPLPPRPLSAAAGCETAAARLASQTEIAARREARAEILRACGEAKSAAGRFLWPLVAIDVLREREGDAQVQGAALVAWLEAHAGDLSPIERRATLLDVQGLAALPDAVRARAVAVLATPRSRIDDLAIEMGSTEARAALVQTERSFAVVPWKSATSLGALRRTRSGAIIGFVVHAASLADALATRRLEVGDEIRAEVSSGPSSLAGGAASPAAGVPGASVEVAPLLLLRLLPRDPGIVARQAKRSRFVLGGVGIGSTLFACVLAALLYRRMRDVERSSDLRTDFVSTVSHELRTPIASLRMLAELLEEGRVAPDEQAEVFSALARESRRLGETVHRLLGFSRMAAGRETIERRRANVAETIAASITAFEERHPEGPAVVRELDATLEADIDPAQIQLAIDNLLANAKKYAPDGGPYVVQLERENDGVAIRVKDRGPGVARRDQKRIFLPFERADDRLSRATEGSGIGLSLVVHVAKAHGGRAWVESEPGQGATFCLWIKAAIKAAMKPAEKSA